MNTTYSTTLGAKASSLSRLRKLILASGAILALSSIVPLASLKLVPIKGSSTIVSQVESFDPENGTYSGTSKGHGEAGHIGKYRLLVSWTVYPADGDQPRRVAGAGELIAANGDKLWVTFDRPHTVPEFSGETLITGGTGRFQGTEGVIGYVGHFRESDEFQIWDGFISTVGSSKR